MPYGTVIEERVTKAVVVVNPDGSFKTAYPFIPKYPRSDPDEMPKTERPK